MTPATLNEHDEKLFWNVCYERYFNPVEFTVDYYGGIVTPEDIERYAVCNFFSCLLKILKDIKRRYRKVLKGDIERYGSWKTL